MITIVTALYAEAQPFLSALQLKKDSKETKYQLFCSDTVCLIVTGAGSISACAAVTRHFTLHPPKEEDILVNLGIAGALSLSTPLNQLFLVTKLTEVSTQHTFYPDILFQNKFQKAELFTVPRPITGMDGDGDYDVTEKVTGAYDGQNKKYLNSLPIESLEFQMPQLVDMETASVYQAALSYISPDRMIFFKAVSDHLDFQSKQSGKQSGETSADQANVVQAESVLASHVTAILDYLQFIQQILNQEAAFAEASLSIEKANIIEQFRNRIPLTSTMEQDFLHLLHYLKLHHVDLQALIQKFLTQLPEQPIRGKKQAMPWLERFRAMAMAAVSELPLPSTNNGTALSCYRPFFSTVYLEEGLESQPDFSNNSVFQTVLHKKDCEVISIRHYKDIFNRGHQNFARQKKAPALILAKKTGTLLYPGAPVCQSFGNQHFYYTSNIMNCIYHCDYCYLQGMYPSGHVVVFANLSDYFTEVEQLLQKHPVYLCISYDTDLLALEPMLHYVSQWIAFASKHPDLTIEIRTKSGNPTVFDTWKKTCFSDLTVAQPNNVIFAWTLSPENLAKTSEVGAASLSLRLLAAKAAKDAGFPVRLCFDPMIFFPGWEQAYRELIEQVFAVLSPNDIRDISIGVFRIGTDYLKIMRKKRSDSKIVWYPYISENGVSHYGAFSEEMVQYLYQLLLLHVSEQQIFIWDSNNASET